MIEGPDWAEQARRLAETLGGTLGGLTGHAPADEAGQSAPECRWCPLCQFLAVIRGERPEVTAALADVLTATANALHAFAAAPGAAEPPEQDRAASASADPAAAAAADSADDPDGADGASPVGDPPPVVQRIEIA
jgi:hypothetical protein